MYRVHLYTYTHTEEHALSYVYVLSTLDDMLPGNFTLLTSFKPNSAEE